MNDHSHAKCSVTQVALKQDRVQVLAWQCPCCQAVTTDFVTWYASTEALFLTLADDGAIHVGWDRRHEVFKRRQR